MWRHFTERQLDWARCTSTQAEAFVWLGRQDKSKDRQPHSNDYVSVIILYCFVLKNGPTPASFFVFFGLFKQTIFTTNQCEKCPSGIRRRDLNPQPLKHALLYCFAWGRVHEHWRPHNSHLGGSGDYKSNLITIVKILSRLQRSSWCFVTAMISWKFPKQMLEQ